MRPRRYSTKPANNSPAAAIEEFDEGTWEVLRAMEAETLRYSPSERQDLIWGPNGKLVPIHSVWPEDIATPPQYGTRQRRRKPARRSSPRCQDAPLLQTPLPDRSKLHAAQTSPPQMFGNPIDHFAKHFSDWAVSHMDSINNDVISLAPPEEVTPPTPDDVIEQDFFFPSASFCQPIPNDFHSKIRHYQDIFIKCKSSQSHSDFQTPPPVTLVPPPVTIAPPTAHIFSPCAPTQSQVGDDNSQFGQFEEEYTPLHTSPHPPLKTVPNRKERVWYPRLEGGASTGNCASAVAQLRRAKPQPPARPPPPVFRRAKPQPPARPPPPVFQQIADTYKTEKRLLYTY
ncbi:uncharacterized protein [Nerophis lumbriciformis]|uniref:uncharacterized protein n=1 Tax=Nerophis lumbriciformis TaxID=546530 RepID=UPI003BAB2A62